MITATRQDVQSLTEGAKNKILERLVTKYDVQAACDHSRDKVLAVLNDLHQENVLLIRQSIAQRDQMWRKFVALEAQMAGMQQEVRAMHQVITKQYDVINR